MKKIINIPHRVCKSTCFSNGLEDIFEWKGNKYIDYLLPVLGGMGEFTYLKLKNIKPPQMVYWGANTKYLMMDLEKILGFKQIINEDSAFKNTFFKIREFINNGQPVVAGALDMYYLRFYPHLYQKRHIPIHYILLVGYDDDKQEVYIHDCGCEDVQSINYDELEKALNVNVPGMSKKNTIRTFVMPEKLPSELEIAQNGLNFRAKKMLYPVVKLFGIPSMRKLAKEIFDWTDRGSFEHLVIYATTPPELTGNFEKSNGMRFWKSQVLRELGEKYDVKAFLNASTMFGESGKLIMEICKAAMKQDREKISDLIIRVADIEETAYKQLTDL